jgi:hypothetical protein
VAQQRHYLVTFLSVRRSESLAPNPIRYINNRFFHNFFIHLISLLYYMYMEQITIDVLPIIKDSNSINISHVKNIILIDKTIGK